MERRYNLDRGPRHSLTAQEAEELFHKVDNSGQVDEEAAERERQRRLEVGHGVDVDPLSAEDPSGSNVGTVIRRAGIALLAIAIAFIVGIPIYMMQVRTSNAQNLSSNVSVLSVAAALDGGIDWGGGYTQFPDEFTVHEADENSGRIEVTVTDTSSPDALTCFSTSQIQATAFATNSLLNPRIDTVIYHVCVYRLGDGTLGHISLLNVSTPAGDRTPFVTFIWTKTTTNDGRVRFISTISGVDDELQDTLRGQIMGHAAEVAETDETEEGAQE